MVKDPRLAYKYYKHAAKLGNKTAKKNAKIMEEIKIKFD